MTAPLEIDSRSGTPNADAHDGLLGLSRCMRQNGISEFPDPETGSDGIGGLHELFSRTDLESPPRSEGPGELPACPHPESRGRSRRRGLTQRRVLALVLAREGRTRRSSAHDRLRHARRRQCDLAIGRRFDLATAVGLK